MTDVAARMRAYRDRLESRRGVLRIEAEVGPLGDLLKANGYPIGDWDLENPEEVARWLQKLVADMSYAPANGLPFYLV